MDGEQVLDVSAHPKLAGAAQTLAGVFDRHFVVMTELQGASPAVQGRVSLSSVGWRALLAAGCALGFDVLFHDGQRGAAA